MPLDTLRMSDFLFKENICWLCEMIVLSSIVSLVAVLCS